MANGQQDMADADNETADDVVAGDGTTHDEFAAPALPQRPAPDRALMKRIIEGALLAAGETLNLERIGTLFGDFERPSVQVMLELLGELAEDYAGRGIELKEVASGFRIQVSRDLGPWVSRLWTEKPPRYSRALLETMALIAYRQPITRGEIEEIRGVSVSSEMIKSLLERDWVRVVGHRDVPGRPALYATTRDFLDYFDLKDLDQLPTLAEIRDLDKVNKELQLEAGPAAAMLAAEQAIVAGDGQSAGGHAELSSPQVAIEGADDAEEDEDMERKLNLQQVDEVLKRVEESFRRDETPDNPS